LKDYKKMYSQIITKYPGFKQSLEYTMSLEFDDNGLDKKPPKSIEGRELLEKLKIIN
jgi:hypothetical protein